MNLAALVAHCAARLDEAQVAFGHGTTNAHDEAAWLVLWRLGLPLDTDIDAADAVVPDAQAIATVIALIDERIRTRKPAAYLTRQAWLQGWSFYVDERVIVPRSLIAEVLVDGSLDYFVGDSPARVLDICTGNGSLAIIAAHVYPDARVLGSDISTDALAVAHINVAQHVLQERVQLVASDGLAAHELYAGGPFDLILCNPPYVNAQSMAALPAEFLAEPALALDGNRDGSSDGMDFVRALLPQLATRMTDNAALVLEIGHERAYFEAAFPTLPCLWLSTSAGEDQVVLIQRSALASLSGPLQGPTPLT
ncbi:MAG: 50S ribosomal protein L3 N(5)-glutamine methyltransferase [Betaproteobacteria bacterium]|nr:50S ribosomal protein L3 N(5)-glutamine methyltransferase [Betaproteobacteria bacterium]